LTVSADPETGFAGTPGATIPSSQIQIKGTEGSSGNLTVPVKVSLDAPLVVTANQSNALDLDFDLSHPAFIAAHVPVGPGATMWRSTLTLQCGIPRSASSRGWCCGTCTER